MNSKLVIQTSNDSFADIISNGGQYKVPRFQRDYTWDKEQWEDLWTDIEYLPEELYHYMGYIVVQQTNGRVSEIIDGQQWLTTLSLIILAGLRKFQELADNNQDKKANEKRIALFRERFIGARNTVTLKIDKKLSLNRNNDKHFQEMCSRLNVHRARGLTNTNSLLNKAFTFFTRKIDSFVTEHKSENIGEALAKLIEQFTSQMIFTKIIVQDAINAYKVFETLNARGVQLSIPDLLKNYILSTLAHNNDVSDTTLDDFDEDWAWIIEQLEKTNFTDFVRYHYNMQYKLVTKNALFREVCRQYHNNKTVIEYLRSLKEYAPVYAALLHPPSCCCHHSS